ncbi:hypothetical protein AURDEDRAFT_63719 [Auricularia subglabra TFB-10046 SS5]|nr:hypothetical protein AURDEDRAFT_63719 [Auricularia subglabra TFB-10046 SS5]
MTIDYSSKQVWEERFTKYPDTFEWLGSSDNLLPYIASALEKSAGDKDSDKRILHIGCGTSKLGFALRDALNVPPQSILNLDYARRAIELGQEHESQNPSTSGSMHWVCGDLLVWQNLNAACSKFSPFSLIIDKSTGDALACGLDIEVPLPFLPSHPSVEISPLPLLALHLAALVLPGAYWVAMSYSTTRFDFLNDKLPLDIPGVPTPGALWTVERMEEAEAFQQPIKGAEHVHRPPVVNHIYVLRRTETPIEIWPSNEF